MTSMTEYSGIIKRGDQIGRTLGFPTANLDATILRSVKQSGVYACVARLGEQQYSGVLYLGPRIVLGETRRVLEIHILDFSDEVYGQTLYFRLGRFIRLPSDFPTTADLVTQLGKDVQAVRDTPQNLPQA